MSILWVGQDYLIKHTVIDDDTEYDKITPVIELVQDKYILPILGTNLFNAFEAYLNAFVDSGTPIPTPYKLLLDNYILKMIVHYCMYEASPTFKFRYANKGIMVKDSDNSQAISTEDMQYIMNIWKMNGEMYGDRMIKYLAQNNATYPEYNTNTGGNVFPIRKSFETDIYLGQPKFGHKDYSNITNNADNPIWY